MHKLTLAFVAFCAVMMVVGCSSNTDSSATPAASTDATKTTPPTPPAATPAAPTDAATPPATPPATTDASTPAASGTAVSFTKDIKPMTDKYCMPCHGDNGKGGLSLTYKDDASAKADKAKFDKAAQEVEGKKMPPAKAPNQPSDEDRAKLVTALKGI